MRVQVWWVIPWLALVVAVSCGKRVIESNAGRLEFDRVEYLERYPKDCLDVSPICNRVLEGYEIVLVTFHKLDPDATSKDDPLGGMSIEELGVTLRGSDGTEDKPFLWGGGPEEIFVGFTPKKGQPYHVLSWPGNEDFRLVRQ